MKSLENHIRYIVDETQELLRDLQLKASKTRVVVAWTVDKYEMRADRLKTAEKLEERLRDYVTDVKHAQVSAGQGRGDGLVQAQHRHRMLRYGPRRGSRASRAGSRSTELSILRANPSLQRG